MAEYEACILGIRMAVDITITEFLVIGDSDLLINQVHGEWTTKNVKILPYLHCVKELYEEPDDKPWYYDIKRFLKAREYLENATSGHKWALRRLENHIIRNGEVLYKRTPDLDMLMCVDSAEATRLLEEIHVGTCGPHMNGFTLAKKSLRAG
ncbi:uncharacterized protein [Nicotiana tomentosiformis]|uniref:uncharacterized protein n=1 Tax=Nicotiana tomentosiformis TaxID=4098 RepID=UPI00388C700A